MADSLHDDKRERASSTQRKVVLSSSQLVSPLWPVILDDTFGLHY